MNKPQLNKLLVATLGLSSALVAGSAAAGDTAGMNVLISTVARSAEGSLGTIRNSPDNVQALQCIVTATASTGVVNGSCNATNTAGTNVFCSTTSSVLLEQMRSIKGDSHVRFTWNTDGTCSTVKVQNGSQWSPKDF